MKKKTRRKFSPVRGIINLFVILAATVSIIPFVLMFLMSTQNNQTIFAGDILSIGNSLAANFQTILDADYFRALQNSLIVAVSSTVLTVFFGAMAGFGFAKYNFKHKNLVFQLVLLPELPLLPRTPLLHHVQRSD